MWKENIEQKLSEKSVIKKATTTSVRRLKTKLSLRQNASRPLQKSNERMMRRYGEQKMVVGRCIQNLVECVTTRSIGMPMCISTAILKFRLEIDTYAKPIRLVSLSKLDKRFPARFPKDN